jgi:hypothetical protein
MDLALELPCCARRDVDRNGKGRDDREKGSGKGMKGMESTDGPRESTSVATAGHVVRWQSVLLPMSRYQAISRVSQASQERQRIDLEKEGIMRCFGVVSVPARKGTLHSSSRILCRADEHARHAHTPWRNENYLWFFFAICQPPRVCRWRINTQRYHHPPVPSNLLPSASYNQVFICDRP